MSAPSAAQRRRRAACSEPCPVTYLDPSAPAARLSRAILSANTSLVRRLLDRPARPDGRPLLDPRNPDPVTKKTSLLLATEVAALEIVRLLIEEYAVEADCISRDIDNNTVVHLAAAEGLDDIITLYHSHYPFVLDWANSEGLTPLHVASQRGHEMTVSLLLDLQADVELTDNEGNTALHYAAGWGHLKIVLLLIDRGSPFWAKNNQTFTASDYAFSFSIQSALQESARAHLKSRKTHQRQQRQLRDKDKDRSPRAVTPAPAHARSGSPSSTSRTPRLRVDEVISNVPSRSTSMPQVITTPPTYKSASSPTLSSGFSKKRPTPLASIPSSSTLATKGPPSPTNSVNTSRTVSHLISKDLEAIEDFRTRTGSLVSTANGAHSPNSTTNRNSSSDSPACSVTNSHSRLLPLQLVSQSANASGSGTLSPANSNFASSFRHSRPRSSTGNSSTFISLTAPGGRSTSTSDGRNRACSTDSENSLSFGHREGLSRLRYIRNTSIDNTAGVGGTASHHLRHNSSGTGTRSCSAAPSSPSHPSG